MIKILVVDDEADIREILSFNLSAAGYQVIEADSGEAAMLLIQQGEAPDLILLDVMLPGISGFKLAGKIRSLDNGLIPIIFLTARDGENDLLTGFSAGGDDYIRKPFSTSEVLARIQAVLRRSRKHRSNVVQAGPLSFDTAGGSVAIDGQELALSRKEFEILLLLASEPGRSFSRDEILQQVWGAVPYVLERTVDVHIARIRAKLGEKRALVQNRQGFGYSLELDREV